jgi:hypothetical protein
MTERKTAGRWWGAFTLPVGSAGRWHLGPTILTISHLRNEWRVCRGGSEDGSDISCSVELGLLPETPDSSELLTRYSATDGVDSIRITPIMPDRSVVARLEHALVVAAQGSVTVFVGSPLWLRLEEAESTLLDELPARQPRLTWWGPSTREGIICYGSRTYGRLRLQEVVNHPHRVLTAVKIANRAASTMKLERLNLPVRQLRVYATDAGQLWTESVVLKRRESQELAELEVSEGPPQEAAAAEPVSGPRDQSGGFLFRAFDSLFK